MTKLRAKIELFLIDPQVDFADPGDRDAKGNVLRPQGALYVSGAEHDMARVGDFIKRAGHKLNDIHVSLDSHHRVHIANPIFWINSKGEHPNPFTVITVKDMQNGTWTTTKASMADIGLRYLQSLEKNHRYSHMIWPPHCLIGFPGHNVFPSVLQAIDKWTEEFRTVHWITKGSNPFTEHFSALKAEVPDPSDPGTQMSDDLIVTLKEADEIPIAGIAGSHCVANSVFDVANAFGDDSYIKKLVLLTDTISPVTGCEALQENFIKEMTARGMRTSTSDKYLA